MTAGVDDLISLPLISLSAYRSRQKEKESKLKERNIPVLDDKPRDVHTRGCFSVAPPLTATSTAIEC